MAHSMGVWHTVWRKKLVFEKVLLIMLLRDQTNARINAKRRRPIFKRKTEENKCVKYILKIHNAHTEHNSSCSFLCSANTANAATENVFQATLNENLKWCDISKTQLESAATKRSSWRCWTRQVLSRFEKERCLRLTSAHGQCH